VHSTEYASEAGLAHGVEGQVRHDPAVDRGEGFRHVGRRLARVPEHGQPAASPQRLRCLGRSRDRVHPVPGLPGDDRIELAAGGIPGFERRHLDLESAPPRQAGHPRVDLDPEHPAAGRLELARGDAGADADVEDAGAGAGGDDPAHHGPGIAGPGPVVAFGVRAERLRYLPGSMRLVPGKRRSPRR